GHDPHLVAGGFHVALDDRRRTSQPCNEALQRRRFARFIFKGQFQKLIERVGGFEAESGENLPPSLLRSEQPGEKPERALVARPRVAAAQQGVGLGKLLPVGGARRKRRTQGRAPPPGKFEQKIVVKAEQRALERNREGKVVLRQQQRVGKRHE